MFRYLNSKIDKVYPHLDDEQKRSLFVMQMINLLLMVAIIPWIFLYAEHGAIYLSYSQIGYVFFLLSLFSFSSFVGMGFKLYRFIMIVASIIIMTMPTIILGKESVSIFGLVFLPVGMILVFTHQEKINYFRYLLLFALSFSVAIYWIHNYEPFLQLDSQAIDELNLGDLITVLIASMVLSFIYFQKNTNIQNNLRIERAKSDNILLKIFPELIVKRLKKEESDVVDYFDEVTVVFIDIVGFTKYADRMAPQELVKMLDDFFSSFDAIAKKYQIEKIKTIGDAYMAVAGLPKPNPQHYLDAANFALEIQKLVSEDYLKKYNLEVRIGMHSGPVVAGVIGESKFSYDLWGSVVNIASRFESQGEPGKIHISEEIKDLLEGDFEIEFNGSLEIKGLGLKKSYFLEKKKR